MTRIHDCDTSELLARLGISNEQLTSQSGKFSREGNVSADYHFKWAHLASTHTKLRCIRDLAADGHLLPPRTGHIGNWTEIGAGRSGPMDFNAAICRRRQFGYPLLNDLTTTETLDGGLGDSVYLPGSMVDRGKRRLLPLYSWTGDDWEIQDRSESYYVPVVQVGTPMGLIPLTRFHRDRDQRECGIELSYYSDLIRIHEDDIVKLLVKTIESELDDGSKEELLRAVLHNCMSSDGRIRKLELQLSPHSGIHVNGCHYRSVEAVIRATLTTVLVASECQSFENLVAGFRPFTPLFSGPLHTVLYALLDTHHPAGRRPLEHGNKTVVHVHWAATQMAGYPPLVKGYFASNIRHYRRLSTRLAAHMNSTRTVIYIVAPASVFTLCPSSMFPDDTLRLATLFLEIAGRCSDTSLTSTEMQPVVSGIAKSWWSRNSKSISNYYKSNFGARRTVAIDSVPSEGGQPVILEEFLELTFMQLSALVGEMHRLVRSGLS
jgi:hypothetical protein